MRTTAQPSRIKYFSKRRALCTGLRDVQFSSVRVSRRDQIFGCTSRFSPSISAAQGRLEFLRL